MKERQVKQDLPPIKDVVENLQNTLGERLTALIGGVKNVRIVSRWARGVQRPTHEWNLRLAYTAAHEIMDPPQGYDAETARTWFMGSFIDDRSPALVIADAKKGDEVAEVSIIRAARAFLVE